VFGSMDAIHRPGDLVINLAASRCALFRSTDWWVGGVRLRLGRDAALVVAVDREGLSPYYEKTSSVRRWMCLIVAGPTVGWAFDEDLEVHA